MSAVSAKSLPRFDNFNFIVYTVLQLLDYPGWSERGKFHSFYHNIINIPQPRVLRSYGINQLLQSASVDWKHLEVFQYLIKFTTPAVRHAESLHSFKRRLKSHFFSLCFND